MISHFICHAIYMTIDMMSCHHAINIFMIPFECHHAKFICHILMHTCNANLNFTHNLNIEFWCNVIFMLSFIWCLSLIWPIHTSLNPRVKVFPVFPSCRIFDRGKERGKLEKENLAHTRQKTRKIRERKRQRKKRFLRTSDLGWPQSDLESDLESTLGTHAAWLLNAGPKSPPTILF